MSKLASPERFANFKIINGPIDMFEFRLGLPQSSLKFLTQLVFLLTGLLNHSRHRHIFVFLLEFVRLVLIIHLGSSFLLCFLIAVVLRHHCSLLETLRGLHVEHLIFVLARGQSVVELSFGGRESAGGKITCFGTSSQRGLGLDEVGRLREAL